MFERFSDPARQVVVLAQHEARALKHDYIGTEHLLLGLLREEEGLAARVLQSLGVGLDQARDQVSRMIGQGEEVAVGQIPFTPRAKKVLELALREALGLTHNYIGTEHILLGLARENEGVAARILLDFDADAEKIRDAVIGALGGVPVFGSGSAPRAFPERRPRRWTFEYRVEVASGPEISEEWLNERGGEGWELVVVLPLGEEWRAVFKRRG